MPRGSISSKFVGPKGLLLGCLIAACGGSTQAPAPLSGSPDPSSPDPNLQPDIEAGVEDAGIVAAGDVTAIDVTGSDVTGSDVTGSDAPGSDTCSGRSSKAMCGRPESPCRLVTDEAIGPGVFSSLALGADGPHAIGVLATVESSTMQHAERKMGKWSMEPVTSGTWGSIVLGAHGDLWAAVFGPRFATTLWTRAGAGWSLVDQLESAIGAWPGTVVADSSGQVHLLATVGYLVDAHWHDNFKTESIGTGFYQGVAAMTPSGAPSFAYWGGEGGGVTYVPPSGEREALPFGKFVVGDDDVPIGLAVAGKAEEQQPYLLFSRETASGTGKTRELFAARYDGPKSWSIVSIAKGDANEFEPPPPAPTRFTHTTYRPVGVLTDGCGEVRFLYAELQVSGFGSCEGMMGFPPTCTKSFPSWISATLHVAWLDGTQVGHAVVADHLWVPSINGSFGRPVLASDGSIHLTRQEAKEPIPDQASGPIPLGARYLVLAK